MRVSLKDSPYVSLDVVATKGLTLDVSWCWRHWTIHIVWLFMLVLLKDGDSVCFPTSAIEKLTLRLLILMSEKPSDSVSVEAMPLQDSRCVSLHAVAMERLTQCVYSRWRHWTTRSPSFYLLLPQKDSHCICLDASTTEGVMLDLFWCWCQGSLRVWVCWCGCHGRTHIASLLMVVSVNRS